MHVKKGDDVPYKCKSVIKSKVFRSGSLKCGGLMVRTGEYKDEKVNHVR